MTPLTVMLTVILSAALAFVIAFLFLFPSPKVTVPPAKIHVVLEVLFPGTSPAWGLFGGLALAAWTYFLLADMLLFRIGTPYIVAAITLPNLGRSYGVPGTDFRHFLGMINPNWFWVYAAPTVLFAMNLVLVLRARRT